MNVYIHIGMFKAASTTLQKEVFSMIPNIIYAQPVCKSNKTELEDMLYQIIHSNLDITKVKPVKLDKDLIISSELISAPFVKQTKNATNRKVVAERFQHLFPNAKIIVVVRNQIDWLQSAYTQLYYTGHINCSFTKFIDKQIKLSKQNVKSFLDLCDYEDVIKPYTNNKVKVIMFEELVNDFSSCVNKDLLPFLNCDYINSIEEKQWNKRHTKQSVFSNRIVKKVVWFLDLLNNPQTIVPDRIRTKVKNYIKSIRFKSGNIDTSYTYEQLMYIIEYYKDSNRWLTKYLNKDLKQNKYI